MDDYTEMLFRLPEPPELEEPERLTTSVTALVTYATCPRRYYWSEVDRLPRRHSPAARRGVEVHRRIELFHRGVVPFDDLDESLYDLVPGEGTRGTAAYDSFLHSRFASERPFLVEAPFELRLDDLIWLRGRIDAIYRHGDRGWEVVDFKTGRPGSVPNLVQLEAYAVAAREVPFAEEPPDHVEVTFAYLGDGLHVESHRVDDQWAAEARRHLEELAAGIRDRSYEASPSAACERCDFLRFCAAGKMFVRE